VEDLSGAWDLHCWYRNLRLRIAVTTLTIVPAVYCHIVEITLLAGLGLEINAVKSAKSNHNRQGIWLI